MADLVTVIQSSLKILSAPNSTFTDRSFDDTIDFDQTTEVFNSYSTQYTGQAIGQVIDFGEVAFPTFIFIKFTSTADGNGANPLGTHEKVVFSINGSTNDNTDLIFLWTADAINDTLPNTITFDSVLNSNTNVRVFVAGRKT